MGDSLGIMVANGSEICLDFYQKICYGRADNGGTMGRHPIGNRKYEIQHMWDVHHNIKRLAFMGWKSVDIARELNVTEVMVSYTLNSPMVQKELAEMRAVADLGSVDVAKRIKEIAAEAVEKMRDHVHSEKESISLAASKDILDRAGHAAVKKEAHLHGFLTEDDIKEMKERATAASDSNGNGNGNGKGGVIDV
jgi:predicted transcriptional regulator